MDAHVSFFRPYQYKAVRIIGELHILLRLGEESPVQLMSEREGGVSHIGQNLGNEFHPYGITFFDFSRSTLITMHFPKGLPAIFMSISIYVSDFMQDDMEHHCFRHIKIRAYKYPVPCLREDFRPYSQEMIRVIVSGVIPGFRNSLPTYVGGSSGGAAYELDRGQKFIVIEFIQEQPFGMVYNSYDSGISSGHSHLTAPLSISYIAPRISTLHSVSLPIKESVIATPHSVTPA